MFLLVGSQSNDNVHDSITFCCSHFCIHFVVRFFQADEPSEDPSLMEDYARTAIPEEGFKGKTNIDFFLLGRRIYNSAIGLRFTGTELLRS